MFATYHSMPYLFTIYKSISVIFNTTTKRIFHFYIVESNTCSLGYYQLSIVEVALISTINSITIRCFGTHRDCTYFVSVTFTRVSRVCYYFLFSLSYRNIIGKELIATSAFIAACRVSVTVPTRIYF